MGEKKDKNIKLFPNPEKKKKKIIEIFLKNL